MFCIEILNNTFLPGKYFTSLGSDATPLLNNLVNQLYYIT